MSAQLLNLLVSAALLLLVLAAGFVYAVKTGEDLGLGWCVAVAVLVCWSFEAYCNYLVTLPGGKSPQFSWAQGVTDGR